MEASGERCDPGEGAIIKEAVWYRKRTERFGDGKKEIIVRVENSIAFPQSQSM
jgi:hypothetical protein